MNTVISRKKQYASIAKKLPWCSGIAIIAFFTSQKTDKTLFLLCGVMIVAFNYCYFFYNSRYKKIYTEYLNDKRSRTMGVLLAIIYFFIPLSGIFYLAIKTGK